MPRLLRRRLRCYYCNNYSQTSQGGIPRTWRCVHCEAVNHLDERGEITDPPVEATTMAAQLQFARTRSPTPTPLPASESPFCDTCQRNQLLLSKTLAEYLPEEDDPKYAQYEASVDAYRAELEERYPQVCDNCIGRVRDQIRAAGYAAKTDHLRRVLEQSNRHRAGSSTPRQEWTLRVVALGRWLYIFSIAVGVAWHASGLVLGFGAASLWSEGDTLQVVSTQIGEYCSAFFTSPSTLWLAQAALVADLLSIWWNPRLARKTNRPGGRMHGLKSLWLVRVSVLALRFFSLADGSFQDNDAKRNFQLKQGVMLAAMILSAITSWNIVRIVYPSASFARPMDEHLPNVPGSAERTTPTSYRPVRPDHSSFDTMAQAFTSSFAEPNTAYPPSPTLTDFSATTQETATTTPFSRRSTRTEDDAMDWTPTSRRFAPESPTILPPLFTPSQSSPTPASRRPLEPHSIFSKKDPNPFRHKVPAAPKAPAQAKADPWRQGFWAPPLKETQKNFFKEDREARPQSQGDGAGLRGVGVPRNVQRDADMFRQPKLKYDYYGTPKETGLENSFNDLFSK